MVLHFTPQSNTTKHSLYIFKHHILVLNNALRKGVFNVHLQAGSFKLVAFKRSENLCNWM